MPNLDTVCYIERPPPPDLAHAVDRIWFLTAPAPMVRFERIVPDGCVEFVANLAAPVIEHRPGLAPTIQAPTLVVGPTVTATVLEPRAEVDWVGVRLRPEAARSALGVSPEEMVDRIVPLTDCAPRLGSSWADELHSAATPSQRFDRAVATLRRARLAGPDAIDPVVRAAAGLVADTQGRIPMDRIARLTGTSPRTLQRRFRAATGVGPKLFARLARLNVTLQRLSSPGAAPLPVLLEQGYYDHSHFLRDFKAFVGVSPSEYWTEDPKLAALLVPG